MTAHLPALNRALAAAGVKWEVDRALYSSCLRMPHDGSFEAVVSALFSAMGWPPAAGESVREREEYCRQLHEAKRGELVTMLESGEVPLCDGVQQLVDDAAAAGVRMAVLAGTATHPDDMAAHLMVRQMGPGYAALLPVFDARFKREHFQHCVVDNPDEPCVLDDDCDDDEEEVRLESFGAEADVLEDVLALSARDRRRSLAADAAQHLAGLTNGSLGFIVDNALGAPPAVRPQTLIALADVLGVDPASCVALVGSSSAVAAAASAGFVAVAVRSGITARGEFPAARAVYDCCGPGGGATIARLASLVAGARSRS
eukprot:PRCOL_00006321-RA